MIGRFLESFQLEIANSNFRKRQNVIMKERDYGFRFNFVHPIGAVRASVRFRKNNFCQKTCTHILNIYRIATKITFHLSFKVISKKIFINQFGHGGTNVPPRFSE